MQYLNVPLLKSSAKELFFKAVVVFLAYDVIYKSLTKNNIGLCIWRCLP